MTQLSYRDEKPHLGKVRVLAVKPWSHLGPSVDKLFEPECSYYNSSFYWGFNTVVDEGANRRANINVLKKIVVFIWGLNGGLKKWDSFWWDAGIKLVYDLFERSIDYRDHVNNSMIVIRKKPVYLSNFVNVCIISCNNRFRICYHHMLKPLNTTKRICHWTFLNYGTLYFKAFLEITLSVI